MKVREPRQINNFKVIDDQGNEYTLVENQNVAETRSLKMARGRAKLVWASRRNSRRQNRR